ncbi:hypothetical protein FRC20_011275 [Serendipita sp. 405]|nr:hypothetical protein FRC20_011275 [Serendipita sp. 405]
MDSPRDYALIICDMQEGYRGSVPHFSSVLATALRMIRLARLVGIRVFLTEGRPSIYGSIVHEIEHEIAQLPQELFGGSFIKTKYFGHSMKLTQTVTSKKFRHVMVCGVEAHIGVRVQTIELMKTGVIVNVILDGISSRNKEEIAPSVATMRDVAHLNKFIAYFGTSETIAYAIIGNLKVPVENFLALIQTESQSISTGLKNLLGSGDDTVSGDSSEAIE